MSHAIMCALSLLLHAPSRPPGSAMPHRFYVAYDKYGTRIGADRECKALTQHRRAHTILQYEQRPFRGCK